MTDDRLEQIKARRAKADPDAWRYDVGPASKRINRVEPADAAFIVNVAADVDWLVAEVERLRYEVEITERANLANGQMVAKMAGYVPREDQRRLLGDERRRF